MSRLYPPSGTPALPAVRAARSPLALWVVLVSLVLLGGWTAASYNRMVRGQQSVDAQWAQVDSVYQRRGGLLPHPPPRSPRHPPPQTAPFPRTGQTRGKNTP